MPKYTARNPWFPKGNPFDRVVIFDPSRPMTAKQVADFLGISQKYVYALFESGELPGKKYRGKLYFNPRKIYEYAGMEDYLPTKVEVYQEVVQ